MKRRTTLMAAALLGSPLLAAAHEGGNHGKKKAAPSREQKPWGIAGEPKAARRSIEIAMTDNMRFTPDRIAVQLGETVRFVLKNQGKMLHEIVIGTQQTLEEHAALMLKFPTMEHDEPYMAHVKPGGTGELVWHFNRAGEFDFACLIPGHYQAGMKGRIAVAETAAGDMTEGEVRKVDKENRKLTLKHGPIKNLDMPPMTMVFQVNDPALLGGLQPGDKVRFRAAQESGRYVVLALEPAK